ncbi:MAG: DMT family transporter [bacterium]
MTKSRRLAYLALITTATIWGSTIAVAKGTFDVLSPLEFLYFRYLLATLISFPFLIYLLLKLHPKLSSLLKISVLEIFGTALPLLLLYEGVNRTSAIESSLISATSPIFTVLGGVIFLKERETKREWQGLALSFFGTLLLVIEPILRIGSPSFSYSLSGNMMIIVYNLLWTAYCLFAKRHYHRLSKVLVSTVSYPLYVLVFLIIFFLSGQSLPPLSLLTSNSTLLSSLAYITIFSSFIAGTLYIYGQDKIEASEASVFTYLQGVVAIPIAFLILGEKPTFLTLLAVLFIAYGVYRAELKTKR